MSRTIRVLTLAEIGALLDWAAAEGWNPGLDDAAAFQAADPNGFIGAFVEGQLVAGISSVAYDEAFGFIGLYICHPDWRGQGHGKAVWDAGMAHLGGRTIGLDGVPEQQANYASMGFVPTYETIRMSGSLTSEPVPSLLPSARVEDIATLDVMGFPARRDDFLGRWLATPRTSLMATENGTVAAYAVIRACRDGAKIGPLFAHDLAAATAILDTLSGPMQIDVPAVQTAWLETLAARGMTPGFRTTRMYRGTPPRCDPSVVFGITTLELG